MLGAIAGDMIGSLHEHAGTKTKEFPLFTPRSTFTDDTVLTIAVADALLHWRDYVDSFHEYFSACPDAGYSASFMRWTHQRIRMPYNSYGNGSATHQDFDRLWLLATSGHLRHAYFAATEPRYGKALATSVSFSNEPIE